MVYVLNYTRLRVEKFDFQFENSEPNVSNRQNCYAVETLSTRVSFNLYVNNSYKWKIPMSKIKVSF